MKSIAKNSIYNILYRCLNVVFPLITAAYVSRILTPDGIGKVSSAQNIVTYFTLLAALGLPTYGTKIVASVKGSTKEQSKAFSELFVINAISTFICTVLYVSMISVFPYFVERWTLYAVCGLAILFNIINVDWFYQGKEEYRYIMLRSMIVKILSTIAIFVFVKTIEDFIVYAFITTIAKVLNYIFNIVHIRKYVSFTIHGLDIKRHIKPVFVLLAASIAIEIYTLADTTMLTIFHTDAIVGYYATAIKGINVVKTLVTAVSAVFLPRLSYYYLNGERENFHRLVDRGIKILGFLSIPAAVGLLIVADDLVKVLFGSEYVPAILTTQILAMSIVTVAFSNFFGYQVLVTIGAENKMLHSTIIGAVIHVILNLLLIGPYGHNGVAISTLITELIVTLVQLVYVYKRVSIKFDIKYWSSVFISTLTMAFAVAGCRMIIQSMFLRFVISMFIGVIVYLFFMCITKNEMISIVKGKLHRKGQH